MPNGYATAGINLSSCPSKSIEAYFEAPGLEFNETPIEVRVDRGQLLDEDFVRMTSDQISVNAQDLVSYSGTMSQFAASEPTMFCIIDFYGKQDKYSGIVQELKAAYLNTFGSEYIVGKFTCPPADSLAERIDSCVATPTDRTPFCNTVKLYDFTKKWFVDSYLDAKVRGQKLSESQLDLKTSLTTLQEKLKAEVVESDGILGIETGFGDDDQ
ncbi:MAG: hypothetical protein M3Q07_01455 [Pseudobdellovibrionaceae bacterium]|nr:hypothetical protein [Pseudobdellovibrionaceae bacterium]